MIKSIILDAGPVGRIAHPRANPEVATGLEGLLTAGVEDTVAEIPAFSNSAVTVCRIFGRLSGDAGTGFSSLMVALCSAAVGEDAGGPCVL